METIFAKIAQETTKFDLGDEEPLYPKSLDSIGAVKDEQYGPAERNRLDVFFPRDDKTKGKPVVLFVHGGGFLSGDKGWTNVGWSFARRGFVAVLANYRLVPNIFHNIAVPKYGQGSPDKVILLGHSSGGAHIAMSLYAAGDPKRTPKALIFLPVAGVFYLSVPFWFDRKKPVRQKSFAIIWIGRGRSLGGILQPLSPLGLFQSLSKGSPLLDPERLPAYIGSVKWEIKETADATATFFNAHRERSIPQGTLPTFHVQEKHNHISNVFSIGTADSAQGERLLEFMQSCVANIDQRIQRTISVISSLAQNVEHY
ncbi:alpha/beta-hydrolase [Aspergillus flavus]|uniref:Alpha/beta-hydrolase n=1 Tax=Aspergillus flavus TaxID=5059 RepID=A0A5N6HGB2_ASPFL|nr:alpha/beta-hydrolase [Aspergillus flavus]